MKKIIVDLFAGGGGASEGIRLAVGRHPDVALNHDKVAIAMHTANHPDTWHITQDIREISPRWATKRKPVGLLWASPDCKHFSKAKGSAIKRDIEIRSLAWIVEKWARDVTPDVIILENVEEFKSWGPLDKNGKIIKSEKGTEFKAFIRKIRRLGYKVEYKILRASNYGAPTIRKRLFLIARSDGNPIVWPESTHGPDKIPYRTAAEIIDFSIPCPSIFERKKPLVENTLKRIAEGIRRYVIENADPFIISYYGPKKGEKFRGTGINKPLPTQSTANRFGLVVPHIQKQFGQGVWSPISKPIGSITAGGLGKTALVSAFLAKHYTGVIGHEIDKPTGTITTKDHHAVVTSSLLKYYGTCKHGQPVTEPLATTTTSGTHIAEVRAFLIKYYSKGGWQSLEDPMHTVATKDRLGLVTVIIKGEPYIITDIGMRMLSPRELYRAQGFSDDYKIDIQISGKKITKTDQVRCCGNSVCPPIAKALVEANYSEKEYIQPDHDESYQEVMSGQ